MAKQQPWSSSDATEEIRKLGASDELNLSFTSHFQDRLAERDLIMGDVRYVLKHGFVFDAAQPATQAGLYRYRIETRTPNSNNRSVRLVVVPDPKACWIKVITVMWADENSA